MLTSDVFYLKMIIKNNGDVQKVKNRLDTLLNMETEILLQQDDDCIFKLKSFKVSSPTKDVEFHKALFDVMIEFEEYSPHIVEFEEN